MARKIVTKYNKKLKYPNRLFINGKLVARAKSEVELVRKARKHGIDFSRLDFLPSVGSSDSFFTNWFDPSKIRKKPIISGVIKRKNMVKKRIKR